MLQPITIDGRAGQVMYLNDAWTPVDANEATLAKVLFEDGGSTFYTISQVEPRVAGGAGSGNFGHAGRPGEVGGSAPAMESSATTLRSEVKKLSRAMEREVEDIIEEHVQIADDFTEVSSVARKAVKKHVVYDLTQRLLQDEPVPSEGTEEEMDNVAARIQATIESKVQGRVDLWADTSGDSNPRAVLMQEAVRDEFSLNDAVSDHLDKGTGFDKNPWNAPDEKGFNRRLVRAEYEATQEFFQKNNITHVSLYRGMIGGQGTNFPAEGQRTTVNMQPASSWSIAEDIATMFADPGYEGAVFTTRVPASRVLSTAVTGRGALNEGEVILLGGPIEALVTQRFYRSDGVHP